MRTRYLIFLIFIYFSCNAQYGAIKGIVFDRTNTPISFIEILAINELQTEIVNSGLYGDFKIAPLAVGKNRIITKCMGYKYLDTTVIVLPDSFTTLNLVVDNVKFGLSVLNGANKVSAKEMIKCGQPAIYFYDSINSVLIKEDQIFEFIYHIRYGNTWIPHIIDTINKPGFIRCGYGMTDTKYREYNEVVFKYLDEKYGDAWRRKVNPSAIGL